MNTEERIKCLQGIDLFRSFSEQELKLFAQNISEESYSPGDVLFNEGEIGRDMFILLEGALTVFKESRTITEIKPVDYIGEMAIIEAKPRSATVQAEEPSLLLKVTSEQFQKYFATQPRSLVSMMKTLSQRIRKDTEIIAEDFEKVNMLIHDMKNGLVSFLFLDLLEKDIPELNDHEYLQRIREARDNIESMMEEALSKAKGEHQDQSRHSASLSDFIHNIVAKEFCVYPDLKDKHVKVLINEDLPQFSFNELDIRRVLTNLVLNAAQVSKSGDTVEIELSRQGELAVVQVRDKGEGIPDNLKVRIFQSHFTTKPNGNGLGLVSCKQIIEEKYGGTLTFQSEAGVGTTFTFTLPLS